MALLQKILGQYDKAEKNSRNLVAIKLEYYGEISESYVIQLKNYSSILQYNKKNKEAFEALEKALNSIKGLMKEKKVKDMTVFKQHINEVIIYHQSLFDLIPGQVQK